MPDHTLLPAAGERQADGTFDASLENRATDSDVPILFGEVLSHDTKQAIVNYAGETGADALVVQRQPRQFPSSLGGDDVDWVEDHAPCDVIEVSDFDGRSIDTVSVVTDGGPFDPTKIPLADGVASSADARISLYYPLEPDAPATRQDTIGDYLSELDELCEAPVDVHVVETDDEDEVITRAASEGDVLFISGTRGTVRERLFGYEGTGQTADSGTVVVYGASQPGPLRRRVEETLL